MRLIQTPWGPGLHGVVAALIANAQAAEVVEPGVCMLDEPATASELFAALDATAGDARDDAASTALLAAVVGVAGFVGVQLVGPSARVATLAPNGRDRSTLVLLSAARDQSS